MKKYTKYPKYSFFILLDRQNNFLPKYYLFKYILKIANLRKNPLSTNLQRFIDATCSLINDE